MSDHPDTTIAALRDYLDNQQKEDAEEEDPPSKKRKVMMGPRHGCLVYILKTLQEHEWDWVGLKSEDIMAFVQRYPKDTSMETLVELADRDPTMTGVKNDLRDKELGKFVLVSSDIVKELRRLLTPGDVRVKSQTAKQPPLVPHTVLLSRTSGRRLRNAWGHLSSKTRNALVHSVFGNMMYTGFELKSQYDEGPAAEDTSEASVRYLVILQDGEVVEHASTTITKTADKLWSTVSHWTWFVNVDLNLTFLCTRGPGVQYVAEAPLKLGLVHVDLARDLTVFRELDDDQGAVPVATVGESVIPQDAVVTAVGYPLFSVSLIEKETFMLGPEEVMTKELSPPTEYDLQRLGYIPQRQRRHSGKAGSKNEREELLTSIEGAPQMSGAFLQYNGTCVGRLRGTVHEKNGTTRFLLNNAADVQAMTVDGQQQLPAGWQAAAKEQATQYNAEVDKYTADMLKLWQQYGTEHGLPPQHQSIVKRFEPTVPQAPTGGGAALPQRKALRSVSTGARIGPGFVYS